MVIEARAASSQVPDPRAPAPVLPAPESLREPERLTLWAWVLGYTAILTTLAVLRSQLWLATGFDLGVYEQGLWLLLHHGISAVSTYTGHPILSLDGSWMLLPLAPLYAVGGSGLLLALQSLALGLGYLYLAGIARAMGVPHRMGHRVGLVYLLSPAILGANLFDFHPTTLVVPILLAVIFYALLDRPVAMSLATLACFTVQWTITPILVLLGVALVLLQRYRPGILLLVIALVGAYIDRALLLPLTLGTSAGDLPRAIGAHLLHHPPLLLPALSHARGWEYLIWMLGPTIALLWTGRINRLILLVLPGLLIVGANLVATSPAATSPMSASSLIGVPFLLVAALSAYAHGPADRGARDLAPVWLAGILFIAFLIHQGALAARAYPSNAKALSAAIVQIPAQSPVIAQNFTAPPLSNRASIWEAGRVPGRRFAAGTYVLLDERFSTGVSSASSITSLRQLLSAASSGIHVLYAHQGVTLAVLTVPTTIPATSGSGGGSASQ